MRVPATLSLALVGAALTLPAGATSYAAPVQACLGQPATIVGTGPSVTGTPGADVIVTADATSVDALGGDDLVCVTSPPDTVVTVLAGDGDDVVVTDGVPAADSGLDGGDGRDQLRTGVASGYLSFHAARGVLRSGAREGEDPTRRTLSATGFEGGRLHAENLWVRGTDGADDFVVDGCATSVYGGRGPDSITHSDTAAPEGQGHDCEPMIMLVGGRGADRINGSWPGVVTILRGGPGPDVIRGGRGVDLIRGGAGRDVVRGHAGDDHLRGGSGADLLDGGAGQDRCRGEQRRRCEAR